jgi:dienelactone hydrolase
MKILCHCLLLVCVNGATQAESTDPRLGPPRTLNNYFPMQAVASAEAWATREAKLRRQVQLAAGLWPPPRKTPLNPVVHGKVERDDYTVERVYFESVPGHYVTGSLYRPKTGSGNRPAVLCPHGHWPNGRFHAHSEGTLKKEIASGAETFDPSGRYPLQARCVQLARMGCVVFHYDMIGYADSIQFTSHRPGLRDHMNTKVDWGYFSPQAELRLQSMMQLQTWNSIRSLDFVASLPGVDPARIAVTGASGGGTQTFMLTAVDPRIAAAFPAVMVSTGMQGGCTCENANYLRINAGNIDIAALAAPRPLGISAADDWTKELMSKGFPELQSLYRMLGVPDKVHAEAFVQYKHNYNQVSRHVMYRWFNRHLKLDVDTPRERDFTPLTREELTVWTDKKPEQAGEAHERELLKWWTQEGTYQLEHFADWTTFRRVVGGAWESIIGRDLDTTGEVRVEGNQLVNRFGEGVAFARDKPGGDKQAILLGTDGSRTLRSAAARAIRDKGFHCMAIDLIHPGTNSSLQPHSKDQKPWKRFVGYTYGYNHPGFVQRVHDVLTAIAYARTQGKEVHLFAQKGTGHVAAAARFMAGKELAGARIELGPFRFADIRHFDHPDFVPGAVKYGDVDALVALCSEYPTTFSGVNIEKNHRFPKHNQ